MISQEAIFLQLSLKESQPWKEDDKHMLGGAVSGSFIPLCPWCVGVGRGRRWGLCQVLHGCMPLHSSLHRWNHPTPHGHPFDSSRDCQNQQGKGIKKLQPYST